MSRLISGLHIIAALFCAPAAAFAQAATSSPQAVPAGALKVVLTCDGCDLTAIRAAIPFVEFVTDPAAAEASVIVSGTSTDRTRTLEFAGRGPRADQKRTLTSALAPGAPADEATKDLVRLLKLGLAEYAASTPPGQHLDLAFRRPGATAAVPASVAKDQKDPWNYWVYRLGANMNASGESSSKYSNYYLSASANRTTAEWKIRLGASRSLNTSTFEFDDTKIESRLVDWNLDALMVKSLGPHWSFGLTSAVVGSTYSNSRRVARFTPGIEYDIFPYSESSRRSLTLQYTIGGANYAYEHETIFSKLEETIATHALTSSLGLRQPWGQVGSSFTFSQHLTAPDRTRISFNANMNVRLLKSLTLNSSGSYSRIRDQFTLEKGEATEEEVLLRQRQLATGYRYSFSIGLNYAFGALSNATVNPRFGGGN